MNWKAIGINIGIAARLAVLGKITGTGRAAAHARLAWQLLCGR